MAIEASIDGGWDNGETRNSNEGKRNIFSSLVDSARQRVAGMRNPERSAKFQASMENMIDGVTGKIQKMTDHFEKNRYGIVEQIGNSVWKEKLEQINEMIKKAKSKLEKLVKALEKARSEDRAERLANDIDHLESVLIPYYEELKTAYEGAISAGTFQNQPIPDRIQGDSAGVRQVNIPRPPERDDNIELNAITQNREILRQNGLGMGDRIQVMGDNGEIEDDWEIHEIAPAYVIVRKLDREGTRKNLSVQEIINLNSTDMELPEPEETDFAAEEEEFKQRLPEIVQRLSSFATTGDPNRDAYSLFSMVTGQPDEYILTMNYTELTNYLNEASSSLVAEDPAEAEELGDQFLQFQKRLGPIIESIVAEIPSNTDGAPAAGEAKGVDEETETADQVDLPTSFREMVPFMRKHFKKFAEMDLSSFEQNFTDADRKLFVRCIKQSLKNQINEKVATGRYPDTIASVLTNGGEAVGVFLRIASQKEGKVLDIDQFLAMPFSKAANEYLGLDVHKIIPNYFQNYSPR